ncbi:NAD(P)-binding domain-containing protein [Orrella marina]|nr:NAD(P)-binding domain-containing protein [Orrella marina]
MRVGFIGLGAMGLPMCTSLARSFEQVLAYDASDAARTRARDRGVYVVPLIDHLQDLDVLITMLPDGGVVRDCLLGTDGARAPVEHMLRKGGVVVDMSSSSPVDSQCMATDLRSSTPNAIFPGFSPAEVF